jgi:ketosteroid isomerase-like protein
MPRENTELLASLYGAVQSGDFDTVRTAVTDDILWDMSRLGVPGLTGVYRGVDGAAEFWTAWLAAWERIEFTRVDLQEHGEYIIVEVKQRNLGRGSGVPVDFHYFQGFAFRDGQVSASIAAATSDEALDLLEQRG